MGFGINLDRMKKFWGQRTVKISLAIFAGIVAVMGIIVLVSLLTGCATNYHTQVKKPTLILQNTGRHDNFTRAFFVVANPTDTELAYKVNCCVPYDPTQCVFENVTVGPHSDKRVSFNTLVSLRCSLDATD